MRPLLCLALVLAAACAETEPLRRPPRDAGIEVADSGVVDAGLAVEDAGVAPRDAGPRDGGDLVDAGRERDAGPKRDAGPAADAGRTFLEVSVGLNFACVRVEAGAAGPGVVRCWGSNYGGALGTGGPIDYIEPSALVVSDNGQALGPVASIDADGAANLAIDANGHAHCWGFLSGIDATLSAPHPRRFDGIEGATLVDIHDQHGCIADASGVWCFGLNECGQLGDGTQVNDTEPRRVLGVGAVDALGLGTNRSCAVEAGRVKCWGHALDSPSGPGFCPSVLTASVAMDVTDAVAVARAWATRRITGRRSRSYTSATPASSTPPAIARASSPNRTGCGAGGAGTGECRTTTPPRRRRSSGRAEAGLLVRRCAHGRWC